MRGEERRFVGSKPPDYKAYKEDTAGKVPSSWILPSMEWFAKKN